MAVGWWADAVSRDAVVSKCMDPESPVESCGVAALALHGLGREALIGLARSSGGCTADDVVPLLSKVDVSPVVKALSGVVGRRAAVDAVLEWHWDAAAGAEHVSKALVARGVPDVVAVERAAAVYGVPAGDDDGFVSEVGAGPVLGYVADALGMRRVGAWAERVSKALGEYVRVAKDSFQRDGEWYSQARDSSGRWSSGGGFGIQGRKEEEQKEEEKEDRGAFAFGISGGGGDKSEEDRVEERSVGFGIQGKEENAKRQQGFGITADEPVERRERTPRQKQLLRERRQQRKARRLEAAAVAAVEAEVEAKPPWDEAEKPKSVASVKAAKRKARLEAKRRLKAAARKKKKAERKAAVRAEAKSYLRKRMHEQMQAREAAKGAAMGLSESKSWFNVPQIVDKYVPLRWMARPSVESDLVQGSVDSPHIENEAMDLWNRWAKALAVSSKDDSLYSQKIRNAVEHALNRSLEEEYMYLPVPAAAIAEAASAREELGGSRKYEGLSVGRLLEYVDDYMSKRGAVGTWKIGGRHDQAPGYVHTSSEQPALISAGHSETGANESTLFVNIPLNTILIESGNGRDWARGSDYPDLFDWAGFTSATVARWLKNALPSVDADEVPTAEGLSFLDQKQIDTLANLLRRVNSVMTVAAEIKTQKSSQRIDSYPAARPAGQQMIFNNEVFTAVREVESLIDDQYSRQLENEELANNIGLPGGVQDFLALDPEEKFSMFARDTSAGMNLYGYVTGFSGKAIGDARKVLDLMGVKNDLARIWLVDCLTDVDSSSRQNFWGDGVHIVGPKRNERTAAKKFVADGLREMMKERGVPDASKMDDDQVLEIGGNMISVVNRESEKAHYEALKDFASTVKHLNRGEEVTDHDMVSLEKALANYGKYLGSKPGAGGTSSRWNRWLVEREYPDGLDWRSSIGVTSDTKDSVWRLWDNRIHYESPLRIVGDDTDDWRAINDELRDSDIDGSRSDVFSTHRNWGVGGAALQFDWPWLFSASMDGDRHREYIVPVPDENGELQGMLGWVLDGARDEEGFVAIDGLSEDQDLGQNWADSIPGVETTEALDESDDEADESLQQYGATDFIEPRGLSRDELEWDLDNINRGRG